MIDRHDEDGQAYVAYYRADRTTGFIWSGSIADPVQVTREMGEPVIDTFQVTVDQRQPTPVVLVQFKAACDRYLEQQDDEQVHRRFFGSR